MFCLHIAPAHVYETNGRAREAVDRKKKHNVIQRRFGVHVG